MVAESGMGAIIHPCSIGILNPDPPYNLLASVKVMDMEAMSFDEADRIITGARLKKLFGGT